MTREEDLFSMKVTVNEVDQHKVTLHIEVPAKEAAKGAEAACKNLAGRVNIPGFRKGKAPRMVLESFLGKDAVKEEIFEAVASKAVSYTHLTLPTNSRV